MGLKPADHGYSMLLPVITFKIIQVRENQAKRPSKDTAVAALFQSGKTLHQIWLVHVIQ